MANEDVLKHLRHLGFSDFLADQVARGGRAGQKSQCGTFAQMANDLDFISQIVTVKSTARREYHSVTPASFEFMRQLDILGTFRFCEFEKVRSDGQRCGILFAHRNRHETLGGEQSLGLQSCAGEQSLQLRNEVRGSGIGPAANERQARPEGLVNLCIVVRRAQQGRHLFRAASIRPQTK